MRDARREAAVMTEEARSMPKERETTKETGALLLAIGGLAPNAAASPPIASRSAPVSFVVSRSLGIDRASSVITAASRRASRMPLRCAGAKPTRNHDAARTARSCHPQQLTRLDLQHRRQL